MKYPDTIEYLYGLQLHGMKFGLDNIRKLTDACGTPHRNFRSVHVGGTNGKGSTSAMIEAIARTAGIRTGLFTSPHLISFTERIRVNGKEITEGEVVDLADKVRTAAAAMHDFAPTFFEVVTTMAMIHFSRLKVDLAVIEVGLGGRLDATNIITPEVSVITGIGLDHCQFLGNSLAEIAAEKAGIIKDNVPVVTASQSAEALEVIERVAAGKKAALYKYGQDFSSRVTSEGLTGVRFDYSGSRTYNDLECPLSGEHQAINASMALKAAELISERCGLDLDVRKGIHDVKWPGRLEMVKESPPILIDGAHNPEAAATLASYLKRVLTLGYSRIVLILGAMADKDIDGIMKPLLPLASATIVTSPAYGRAASPALLEARAASMGFPPIKSDSVSAAITLAEKLYQPGDLIVITGSFYTIGEAREVLGVKGVLTRLRE